MGKACLQPDERARKTVQVVLQRLSGGNQVAIATALGLSESTISRHKNEHLELFAKILAHAGLKVVPVEACVVDERRLAALGELLAAALAKDPNPANWLQEGE